MTLKGFMVHLPSAQYSRISFRVQVPIYQILRPKYPCRKHFKAKLSHRGVHGTSGEGTGNSLVRPGDLQKVVWFPKDLTETSNPQGKGVGMKSIVLCTLDVQVSVVCELSYTSQYQYSAPGSE